MLSVKESRVDHWDEWLFGPCHASGHGDLDGPMTSSRLQSGEACDGNKATMIGRLDWADGSHITNGWEVGNDHEGATSIVVHELFAEDHSKWWTGWRL